jgi:hypothetical protein
MSTVHLDDEEWQRVMSIIAGAPWNVANPLLMKIGSQLREQTEGVKRASDGRVDFSTDQPLESKHN